MSGKSNKYLFQGSGSYYKAKRQEKRKFLKISIFLYRLSTILLAIAFALFIWNEKDGIFHGHSFEWIWGNVAGFEMGDGFPITIVGRKVSAKNFRQSSQTLVVVSDTSFMILSSSAKQIAHLQHNFNKPVLEMADPYYLIYDRGGNGYQLWSKLKTYQSKETSLKIFSAAIAPNGQYMIATQSRGYSSRLTSYLADGTETAIYKLTNFYITDTALSINAKQAATTSVSSKNGTFISRISLFDLNKSEPIVKLDYPDTSFLSIQYSNGHLFAISDKQIVILDSTGKEKGIYSYASQNFIDFKVYNGNIVLLLRPYKGAPTSRFILVKASGNVHFTKDIALRASTISFYGDTVALLCETEIQAFSAKDGAYKGKCITKMGTSAIALANAQEIYVLGSRKIFLEPFKSK